MSGHNPQRIDPQADYDVGFCKPPKSGRFQPGQSGNPAGRKKKPKSVRGELDVILASKVTVNVGGKSKKLTMMQVILRSLAHKCTKGDVRAIQLLVNLLSTQVDDVDQLVDHEALDPSDRAMLEALIGEISGGDDEGGDDPEGGPAETGDAQ